MNAPTRQITNPTSAATTVNHSTSPSRPRGPACHGRQWRRGTNSRLKPRRTNPEKALPPKASSRERRIMVSAQERVGVRRASCSSRNQSALAISGRNTTWS